ncbi:type III-B CRISPR module RAMP protein Cmr4 [Microcoleus sp. herbarium14]|uniref:type III-B CRISPR module RAMP protein Cmr4 n=1 Tax=Microcoleus sp. herbarium14 TaxID=3055439 RepID=UPI002FD64635
MYKQAYGIIETLAPVHVGATAGEESGNLNLIFRDQFTQTGIIPGSSIRGRLRSEIRRCLGETEANKWYGQEAELGKPDSTTESVVKFEYASLLWLPVFCPGQPIVWVTCPRLLKRYQRIAGDYVKLKDGTSLKSAKPPANYTGSQTLKALDINGKPKLFFNFGFLTVEKTENLSAWFPLGEELPAVVVADDEIAMIHDMALYRQSRVALDKEEKKAKKGAFFNTEALPEGTILVFPVAIKNNPEKPEKWQPFGAATGADIYLGGLESIGFGHCYLTLKEV